MTLNDITKALIGNGQFEFFGMRMSQVPDALVKISTLLQISRPTKIIEFGTGYGGLSVLLGIYAKIYKIKFISYDIKVHDQRLHEVLDIDYREKDLSNLAVQEEIRNEILLNPSGATIVLCDALKSQELKLYSPVLKKNDIIMVHDYCYDESSDKFRRICNKYNWTATQEQWRSGFQESLSENNILPLFHEEFEDVLWFCGIKN